jgi:glycosyltransferase involved in cell wall biosynthesis
MRVMHVIEAMVQGGAESLVIEHVRHAAPDVTSIVCAINRGGPALDLARDAGAETLVLRRGGSLLERPAAILRLSRLMRERGVDVVNGHNPTGALTGTLAAALARSRVVVRTEHSVHYEGRHSAFYPPIERWMTRRAAAVICVCDAVRRSHADRQPGLAGRFVTIANGIGPAPETRGRAETRIALGVAPDTLLVLTVGSLTRQKAQHVLIRALAEVRRELPGVELAIAGDGPRRGELEALARELGIQDAVRFLGARGDVGDLMSAADLFVLSSEREGLSVTLLEAMRAGLPVVATTVGGCAEAIEPGRSGSLVPPGDPAALATAIAALARDPERRARMGAEGRARWSARFTAERMVRETEALYRRALGADAAALDSPALARSAS